MPLLPSDILFAPAPPAIGDVGRLADEGRDLFLDAARAQRVFEAARDRRLEPAQSRGIVLRLIDDAKGLVRSVTQSLVAGSVRLSSWFGAMKDVLLPRHFAAGMATLSTADLPPADLEAIADLSRGQVGYLGRFRERIASAAHILGDATVAYAAMYAGALWGTGQDVLRDKMTREGYAFARNILGYSDHCADCLYETSRGLVSATSISLPGSRRCLTSCRCWLEYE
jgi:hypothetical protein